MPIRFRCAYCNQLMGIATRKCGTVVRCPRCAGEVIVPATPEPQAANGSGRLNALLEADDFGKEFADVQPLPPPNPLLPPPAYAHPPLSETGSRAEAPPGASAMTPSVRRSGVFLTPPVLIGAGVGLLVLIGVTFLLGFFLGRWTMH